MRVSTVPQVSISTTTMDRMLLSSLARLQKAMGLGDNDESKPQSTELVPAADVDDDEPLLPGCNLDARKAATDCSNLCPPQAISTETSCSHSLLGDETMQSLSIEIHDPVEQLAILQKQLDTLQRAVVQPLQDQLENLKNNVSDDRLGLDLSLPDEEEAQQYFISSPKHMRSVNEMHFQLEEELSRMRDSLETNKVEWRSHYAYHLERFRQMYAIVIQQYQQSVVTEVQKRRQTRALLIQAANDAKTVRSVLAQQVSTANDLLVENERLRQATQEAVTKQMRMQELFRNIQESTREKDVRFEPSIITEDASDDDQEDSTFENLRTTPKMARNLPKQSSFLTTDKLMIQDLKTQLADSLDHQRAMQSKIQSLQNQLISSGNQEDLLSVSPSLTIDSNDSSMVLERNPRQRKGISRMAKSSLRLADALIDMMQGTCSDDNIILRRMEDLHSLLSEEEDEITISDVASHATIEEDIGELQKKMETNVADMSPAMKDLVRELMIKTDNLYAEPSEDANTDTNTDSNSNVATESLVEENNSNGQESAFDDSLMQGEDSYDVAVKTDESVSKFTGDGDDDSDPVVDFVDTDDLQAKTRVEAVDHCTGEKQQAVTVEAGTLDTVETGTEDESEQPHRDVICVNNDELALVESESREPAPPNQNAWLVQRIHTLEQEKALLVTESLEMIQSARMACEAQIEAAMSHPGESASLWSE